jgi:hypothetical protein
MLSNKTNTITNFASDNVTPQVPNLTPLSTNYKFVMDMEEQKKNKEKWATFDKIMARFCEANKEKAINFYIKRQNILQNAINEVNLFE